MGNDRLRKNTRAAIRTRWLRTRPATVQEAHHRIHELAESLERAGFTSVSVPFLAYLAGDADTLDKAFGLKLSKQSGRPKDPKTDALVARAARLRMNKGLSWKQVADRLSVDERDLRRAYAKRRPKILENEMDRRWKRRPGPGSKFRVTS